MEVQKNGERRDSSGGDGGGAAKKNGGMAEVARVEVTSAEGASEATPKAEVTVEVIAMKKM